MAKRKILKISEYLNKNKINMEEFTSLLKNNNYQFIYDILNCKRIKVIELFLRDYVKINSFPIDRWVKRKLKEYDIECNENKIIEVCLENNINPRYLARAIVSNSNFTGNTKIIDYLK